MVAQNNAAKIARPTKPKSVDATSDVPPIIKKQPPHIAEGIPITVVKITRRIVFVLLFARTGGRP
jgi:hypothetical protein